MKTTTTYRQKDNGWRFAVELDKDEFGLWQDIMDFSIKANNKTK